MKKRKEDFRPDSYEATLTPMELRSLHNRLLAGRETMEEIQEKAVRWRSGERKGEKPETATLGKIQARLRMERMLIRLNESCEKLESYRKLLTPLAQSAQQEHLLDWIMMLVSEEVIEYTLARLHPEARTAAAKLLLKRADQRLAGRRLDMLETEFKKEPKEKSSLGLTEEEKEAEMKRLLGK